MWEEWDPFCRVTGVIHYGCVALPYARRPFHPSTDTRDSTMRLPILPPLVRGFSASNDSRVPRRSRRTSPAKVTFCPMFRPLARLVS